MRNTFIPNSFERNISTKLNNYNNIISKYSSFHTNIGRRGKNKNFINLNYTNYTKTKLPCNNNANSLVNKYKSPYNTNFVKYDNINLLQKGSESGLKSFDKNSIESYNAKEVNNHTFVDDINFMKMKLNFRVLQHKLTNLSNIVLPNDIKSNYNILSKKNKTFENGNYKYNYNTYSFDRYKNINSIGNNLSINEINGENVNHNYVIKNLILNNNININKFNYDKYSLKLEDEVDKEENKIFELNNIDKSFKEDNNNILDFKNINNTESKNLTDKLNENKIDFNEINDNFENKNQNINNNENNKNDVNNGNKKNNNYVISNISGTINYIPPEKKILEKKFKKLNKPYENLKIVNNTFSINSVKSEKKEIEKEKEKDKEKEKEVGKGKVKINEEDFIKSISISLLEEENQKRSESFSSGCSNEKDIKIENKFSPFKKKKKEDCNENNNNKINNINLPIDTSLEEIDENKNTKINDFNFNKNCEKDDDLFIHMNPLSDISRNRNINLLEEENEIDNKKISNTYNSNINNDFIKKKKKVSFEDEIICISYNDTDKPINLKVYKVVDKENWMGIELKFKPKITKNCINILKSKKLINPILIDKKVNGNIINKDNDNLVSFSNKTNKSKKLYKNLNKNRNIINKNKELIKLIEKKVKNQSLEKNKDISQKKDKKSNKESKKDDTKENTLKNGIIVNKNLLDRIKSNNTSKKLVNNYECEDAIQEEEEGYEETNAEKKELNHAL